MKDTMEITTVGQGLIRIKGKQATVLIACEGKVAADAKTPGDALLLLVKNKTPETTKVEELRLIVSGPGEYEVGGVKIGSNAVSDELTHALRVDSVDVLVTTKTSLSKLKDSGRDCHVLVVLSDTVVDAGSVSVVSPRVVVLHGTSAKESATALGKENITPITKYQTTAEKLPSEMEVVVIS